MTGDEATTKPDAQDIVLRKLGGYSNGNNTRDYQMRRAAETFFADTRRHSCPYKALRFAAGQHCLCTGEVWIVKDVLMQHGFLPKI